jgi:hypothetical protein
LQVANARAPAGWGDVAPTVGNAVAINIAAAIGGAIDTFMLLSCFENVGRN